MVGLAAGGSGPRARFASASFETKPEEASSRLPSTRNEWVYRNNRVELLIDGSSTYREMLAAIRRARSYIHLETHIFAGDPVRREFADVLMERARNGVAVRVFCDAAGSFEGAAEFFAALRSAGVHLREHRGDLTRPADDARRKARDHPKILVVDGRVAFAGGANVSRASGRRRRTPPSEGRRDAHIAIRGPAVAGFDRLFASNWRAQGGEIIPTEPRAAMQDVAPQGHDVVQIVHARGGAGGYSAVYHAYLEAMALAAERIWITQAHFAPDRRFVEALRAASRRGVDVRLIVPGVPEIGLVLHAARSRYRALLCDGVRLYETPHVVLHAQTAVIDGVWSTIGSSNLYYRGFLHNEVNAVVLGPRFAGLMEARFLEDTKMAKAVLLKDWQYRPIYDRALGALCRAGEYWL